jgi:ribonuclease HII
MGPKSGLKAGKKPKAALPVFTPDLEWEIRLGYPAKLLIGIDEVGRGCLAGPVVAGAVILPPQIDFQKDPWLKDVNDSKCVSPEKREELRPLIENWSLSFGVGVATVEEIDAINIFQASHLAMVRAANMAISRLSKKQTQDAHAIVDGKFLPKNLPCPATAVIKGDLRCLSVAASSILAKVWRDRHMVELDQAHPGYGFGVHKGYSTPAHAKALQDLGVCAAHRRSFAPVKARLGADLVKAESHVQTSFWLEDRG